METVIVADINGYAPTHVERHGNEAPYITRLPNGQYVSANIEGKPITDAQGRMQAYAPMEGYSPEEKHAFWRGTDPHVTFTAAPNVDETAAIRETLRKRYPGI